jgi:hypothetical protein
MERRKIIGAALFSAAIAGGGVAGFVLGSPLSSSAAPAAGGSSTTTDPGKPAPDAGKPDCRGLRGGFHGGAGLDAAAKAIGVSTESLLSDLKAGKTIAAVAKAKGVAVQKVIDAMVAAAKTEIAAQVKAGRLTSDQAAKIEADLTARITERVNGTFALHDRPGRGFGFRGGFRGRWGPGGPTSGPDGTGTTTDSPTV